MRHQHSFQDCLIFFVVSRTSLSFKMIYCLLQLFVAGKEGVGAGLLLFEHTCFFRVLRLLFIPFCCLLFSISGVQLQFDCVHVKKTLVFDFD